jgi:tRNA nucleotidyltransferase (CCA-adding enzyme)
MDLILCHITTADDFDTLGASVGLTRLLSGSQIVFTGDTHQSIQEFLALYPDEYALVERDSVNLAEVHSLTVVNTQMRDRLGEPAAWLDLPHIRQISVYDHAFNQAADILTPQIHIDSVGATTTLIAEKLQQLQISLTPAQATVMALGIHVNTHSLTYGQTTSRDVLALAWLMEQGASLSVIAAYAHPTKSAPQLQQYPLTAQDLMSSPVRTIRPETTIAEAHRILLRYGHSGLSVVNAQAELVGIISRRDLDIALHHGFGHGSVKGYMATSLKTITRSTTLPEIEFLMVTYDIGRLPVLDQDQLVGIVTRTDVIRELYRQRGLGAENLRVPGEISLSRLAPQLNELLTNAALAAQTRGWHLYLVGGAVRDLLLAEPSTTTLVLNDIDLVVDGFDQTAEVGAGVELAKVLRSLYPHSRLEIHGAFQTAALLWHKDAIFDSLWVDIATSRTEFYPYPAANPEVEASSIRQDLYRRDFSINAMALRLTSPRTGELLDFFGGLLDLRARQIRVLHANSFIEDPTRIYRAVRFATRLGFDIEQRTQEYIRYGVNSGVYDRITGENGRAPALQTRLKTELKYILEASYWEPALKLLDKLGALQCIHATLKLDVKLLQQLRLLKRCLQRFDQNKTISNWQMCLEAIIAHLQPQYRVKVAKNLQLTDDSINRLEKLALIQVEVIEKLPNCQLASEVVYLLRQWELPTLILICLSSTRGIRRKIWQYLTVWRNVQPILNGNDLKNLGYKPGPLYRQILDDLLAATLDRVIENNKDAQEYLATHYSL